mmetsp:Transcript_61952/g.90802  ORF Transcript_61952/g.90802 Transcript_61952/m.90802 type:complete len:112 (-) Transcript_61952:254-589(-)
MREVRKLREIVFTGQAAHVLLPIPAWKSPAEHGMHSDCPSDAEKWPAGQFWHAASDTAPAFSENLPTPHSTQTVEPSCVVANVPALQGVERGAGVSIQTDILKLMLFVVWQ